MPGRLTCRATLWASAAVLFFGCSESASGPRGDGDRRASEPAPVRRTGGSSAPHGDVRVIVYQPQQEARNARDGSKVVPDLLMILVNEGNRGRDTAEGRFNLGLQNGNRGYKVMTEENTANLLKSFENLGWERVASPFVPGDEQLLVPGGVASPGYRGVIFVESSAGKFKFVGQRPNGPSDLAGQERHKTFVGLKTAVTAWYQECPGEMPVGEGTPLPTRLDAKN